MHDDIIEIFTNNGPVMESLNDMNDIWINVSVNKIKLM